MRRGPLQRIDAVRWNYMLHVLGGACVAVIVALLVGAAGHLHDIRTPLVILILFNIAAALYARRAFAD